MRFQQYALFVALLVSVSGCVSPKLAIPIGTLDELTNEHAVVVVGLKALGGEKRYMSSVWQKYDPKTQKFSHELDWQNQIHSFAQSGWGSAQNYGKLNYSVTKVIPGKYYLHFVEYQNSDRYPGYVQRNIAAPYFKGKVDKSLITEALLTGRATLPMRYNFVFDVKPGEIIYIGDFYIDASTFPVKSIEIKNNLEHARMAPKLHPSMRSHLKYRRPIDLALQN